MIKEYSKDNQYSYAIGFFSVIQLLELRRDLFHSLYVQSSSLDTDGYKKILSLISPKDILEELPDVEDLPTIAVIAKIIKKILYF